jgi:hypothetical protein
VAGFNNAFVFGAEPIVYDCHVKFRPGGANALNIDGFGVALDGITMKGDDGSGGGGAVTNHAKIDVINGTAILIAQYWGECYHRQHQRTSHYQYILTLWSSVLSQANVTITGCQNASQG